MQPIFVYEPVDVQVRGEDLYVVYPDGTGTFVMPANCGMRLAIKMLDAIADHLGANVCNTSEGI